jgi:hypothetical protein
MQAHHAPWWCYSAASCPCGGPLAVCQSNSTDEVSIPEHHPNNSSCLNTARCHRSLLVPFLRGSSSAAAAAAQLPRLLLSHVGCGAPPAQRTWIFYLRRVSWGRGSCPASWPIAGLRFLHTEGNSAFRRATGREKSMFRQITADDSTTAPVRAGLARSKR